MKVYFKLKGKTQSGDKICNACRQQFYKKSNKTQSVSKGKVTLTLPIVSAGKTHKCCAVCRKRGGAMVVMPEKARLDVFVRDGILVPMGVRCCPGHLDKNRLRPGITMKSLSFVKKQTSADAEKVMEIISDLRKVALSSDRNRIDFDNPNSLSSVDIENLTGFTRESFDDLVSNITSLYKTSYRSPRQAIGIFLVKMRTGLSDRCVYWYIHQWL